MADALTTLTELLELLLAPILIAELVWLRRRRDLTWARVKEMLANASSFLFLVAGAVLAAATLGLGAWYEVLPGLRPHS